MRQEINCSYAENWTIIPATVVHVTIGELVPILALGTQTHIYI